jgi:hypothetical protein
MPHDLGTWAFIIALGALILAYPLDVLAHLTSPIIRDWWAARSNATLQKRRDVLSARLDKLRDVPVIDEVADQVLKAQELLMLVIGNATNLVLGAFAIPLSSASFFWSLTWPHWPSHKELFLLILMGVDLYVTLTSRRRLDAYRRRVSPGVRNDLKAEVSKIEEALRRQQQLTFHKG